MVGFYNYLKIWCLITVHYLNKNTLDMVLKWQKKKKNEKKNWRFVRSSGLHPVSSHSCCVYVRTGRPAFAWPYAGVHRSTSLMSSSLLLQQCPACLVCLTCIVFVMGGKWPYSWCLVGCWRQTAGEESRRQLHKNVQSGVYSWYQFCRIQE